MPYTPTRLEQYKLPTIFHDDAVVHTSQRLDPTARYRKVEVKHTWRREREIGSGGFGRVWREKEDGGELRAVKTLPRALLNTHKVDYARELDALVELRDVSIFGASIFFGHIANGEIASRSLCTVLRLVRR